MKSKVLIVDDDPEIRTQLKWALAADYELSFAENRSQAMNQFKTIQPHITLLDLGLPPRPHDPDEGLATLSELMAANPATKVIIVSGQGEKKNAIQAVAGGAYDFLCKPIDLDELKLILRRSSYLLNLEAEYRQMQQKYRPDAFENMLGTSPQMQGVFAFVRKVAGTSAPVLLLGESGTGKEMAAIAIHRRSPRKDAPFIAINCNAIPENLLESELFGHEKGAFTGAHVQRKGLIETAAGGTLFLDEIGELPLPIQVKLLRFLQEQRFQRVGGRQEIQTDVRVITATNVDLKDAVAKGKFREDLYFRLAVVVMKLPLLRDRAEDVEVLAHEFLHQFGAQSDKPAMTFSPDALRAIKAHSWPGNVRELQNRVKRAVIMAEGKRVTAADLELTDQGEFVRRPTLKEAREDLERELVQAALKKYSGKITAAAAELGISRPTLYELMEKLGLAKSEGGRGGSSGEGEPKEVIEDLSPPA
jgi:two-component system NtrC family response regulator